MLEVQSLALIHLSSVPADLILVHAVHDTLAQLLQLRLLHDHLFTTVPLLLLELNGLLLLLLLHGSSWLLHAHLGVLHVPEHCHAGHALLLRHRGLLLKLLVDGLDHVSQGGRLRVPVSESRSNVLDGCWVQRGVRH